MVTRAVLIVSWLFYPVAYLLPSFVGGAGGLLVTQIGYSVADIVAKPIFTFLIFRVSVEKADQEGFSAPSYPKAQAA